MRAARYKTGGIIAVEEADVPKVGDGEVLIRPRVGGICGSDIHSAKLGIFFNNVIIGHEFAGVVEEIGSGVQGIRVGDRVTVNPNRDMCNKCSWCKQGQYNLCGNILKEAIGVCRDGGFAEYVKVKAPLVSRLPENVSFEQGAFVEPLACALRAVRISRFCIGETALVIGAGPIGLLTVECLKKAGAKSVYVSELHAARIRLAEKAGADEVLNPVKVDLAEHFKAIGVAPAFVFECSGSPDALESALKVVKERGTITIVGISTEKVQFSAFTAILKEVSIKSSFAYVEEFDMAIELLAKGFFDIDSLVTKVLPLEQISLGFEELKNPEGAVKILIKI